MSGYISGRSSITTIQTGNIAADAVTSAKVADDVIDSEHYTDGSIDTAHIADDQITLAKMASGTDGNIITYDASGNPAAVATGSNGQVLTSAGAGAAPTFVTAAGASDAEAANIMLNAFRISVNGGLSVQNMVDGVVDEFEDETGVDTSTSTDETYDATSDFYSGFLTTYSVIGEWSGATGSYTFSGDDILNVTGDRHIKVDDSFANDFSFSFTVQAMQSSHVGFYPTASDGSFDSTSTAGMGGLGSLSGMFHFGDVGGSIFHANSIEESIGFSAGDVMKWERVGTAVKLYKNGSLARTMTATSSGTVRPLISCGTPGGLDVDDIFWTDDSNPVILNMTLVSNASTALAAPDDANVVIWQEDVDSITLNTDLKAYASRDGGTTFTQTTLAKEASLPGIDVAALIAQASGTAIGNMTSGGGLAASFDGETSESSANSTQIAYSTGPGVGKDWGSGVTKTITKIKVWSPNSGSEPGFSAGGSQPQITIKLYGSAAGFQSSSVLIHTVSAFTDSDGASIDEAVTEQGTAYRYHWIGLASDGNQAESSRVAEVEFYEDVAGPSTNILTGSADISGQPSGTDMKYKIETLNTKDQKIHAVALQWS